MINASLLETVNEENGMPPSVFWALDPSLPRTAAQAAVEFDWLIQKKHGGAVNLSRKSINALSSLLSGSIGKAQLSVDNKTFVDSLGLNLFAKAYNETHKAHPLNTRESLASAIQQLTSLMSAAQQEQVGNVDEDALTKMRDFCTALSEYAAAYRRMIYGDPQEHPYRK